jgi:hypothetical protein
MALYHLSKRWFHQNITISRLKAEVDPTDEEFILEHELSKQGKELEDLDDSSSSSSEDSIYEDVAEHKEDGTEVIETGSGVPEPGNNLEHEIEEEELSLSKKQLLGFRLSGSSMTISSVAMMKTTSQTRIWTTTQVTIWEWSKALTLKLLISFPPTGLPARMKIKKKSRKKLTRYLT